MQTLRYFATIIFFFMIMAGALFSLLRTELFHPEFGVLRPHASACDALAKRAQDLPVALAIEAEDAASQPETERVPDQVAISEAAGARRTVQRGPSELDDEPRLEVRSTSGVLLQNAWVQE